MKAESPFRFDTVLLDADGTLFDFERAEELALGETLTQLGIPVNRQITETYHGINDGLWKDLEQGTVTREQLVVERFRRLLFWLKAPGCTVTPEEINRIYARRLSRQGILYPGAKEFLSDLHTTHRLYLVTNGNTLSQRGRLAASGVASLFSDVFISEELGACKPSLAYFEKVFARIPDFQKEKTCIVGDSLSSDIAGGNRAGIPAIWYHPQSGGCPASHTCYAQASDYSQLLALMRKKEELP